MSNEYKYKVGDKVYLVHEPTISAIVTEVCHEGKYDYYVKPEEDGFESGWQEYELLDAKTAFLTRLQSLLREFDASISVYAEGSYCGDDIKSVSVFITVGDEYFEYDVTDCDVVINADNIMDFDKE